MAARRQRVTRVRPAGCACLEEVGVLRSVCMHVPVTAVFRLMNEAGAACCWLLGHCYWHSVLPGGLGVDTWTTPGPVARAEGTTYWRSLPDLTDCLQLAGAHDSPCMLRGLLDVALGHSAVSGGAVEASAHLPLYRLDRDPSPSPLTSQHAAAPWGHWPEGSSSSRDLLGVHTGRGVNHGRGSTAIS